MFSLKKESSFKCNNFNTKDTRSLKSPDFVPSPLCPLEHSPIRSPSTLEPHLCAPSLLPCENLQNSRMEEIKAEIENQRISETDFLPYGLKVSQRRRDFRSRNSLRFVRKYFLQVYKQNNVKIVRKRYVN